MNKVRRIKRIRSIRRNRRRLEVLGILRETVNTKEKDNETSMER